MTNHYLDHLMGAYFNQDYDLYGETIEEVMDSYLSSEGADKAKGLIIDCANFAKDHPDVEVTFDELYGFDFKPARWGITAQQFLDMIAARASRYVQEN